MGRLSVLSASASIDSSAEGAKEGGPGMNVVSAPPASPSSSVAENVKWSVCGMLADSAREEYGTELAVR